MDRPKKEYRCWRNIKWRCHKEGCRDYHKYGARGITMSPLWYDDFDRFYSDVGPAPGVNYSLDRINNSLGYVPGNVRWATPTEQTRNRRNTVRVEYRGKAVPVIELCKAFKLNYYTVLKKIKFSRIIG